MASIKIIEPNEAQGEVLEIYNHFIKQTGSVPEWAKVMAHKPEILKNFVDLFHAVMGEGSVDQFLKWKIAYTVAELLKCEFCISVTAQMLKKLGADDEMIQKIKTTENLPEDEKIILDLVKDVTTDGHLDHPEIFDQLKTIFKEDQLVEVTSVIGLLNYISRFNSTFTIAPV